MEESMRVEEEGSSSLVEMTELEKEMEESMRVQEEGSSRLVEMYNRYRYTELGKERERWNETSIYLVPAHIKNMKYSSAYRPQLVSLGPFHHGETDLWPMEEHKRRALLHLLKRTDKSRDELVDAVEEVADQLEGAYGQDLALDEQWRGDNYRERFVDMMVTDGCFLLEAMRMVELKGAVPDYARNDPVFSKHGYLHLKNIILADMFVMENQLPMLLLETLARVAPSERSQPQAFIRGMITNMVVAFFGLPSDNRYRLGEGADPYVRSLHPIDIARKILCGERERYADESRGAYEQAMRIARGESEHYADEWEERNGIDEQTIPSALELYEAGIHFNAIRSGSLLEIDFQFQRGELSMPVLRVHNYVGTVFLNLMAFEQLHHGAGNGVTEYLIFMDHIIDSAKDVALLRSKGVMDCALGSDKEVAKLFNTLSTGAMDPFIKLRGVRLRVNDYCRKPRNKPRNRKTAESFVHTYLRNPWVFFSLVAAAVLLVATLLQTIFTIKPLRLSQP